MTVWETTTKQMQVDLDFLPNIASEQPQLEILFLVQSLVN